MGADDLAKRLFQFLLAGGCPMPELRRMGWFDFLRHDKPDSDDARILAAAAIVYLLVDDDGKEINHDGCVVYATLGFVRGVRGGGLPSANSKELFDLLAATPVSRVSIEEWFLRTYP